MPELQGKAIDKVVDEILDMVMNAEKISDSMKKIKTIDVFQEKVLQQLELVRNKTMELEKKVQQISNQMGIVAIESGRDLNEKIDSLSKEYEKDIMQLEEQVNFLRTALIKISNALKNKKIIV